VRLRSGYALQGYRNPHKAAALLADYLQACRAHRVRVGKFRYRRQACQTSPIILCGKHAPAFAAQALAFVTRP
jgi:hypothetical protein